MSALADLRLVVGMPWLGALVVLLVPARAGRAVAIGTAIVVLVALAACVGGAPPIELPWLGRGVALRLELGPLAEIGLGVTGLAGLLAVIEEERPSRARLAGMLALVGTVLTGLLAGDVGVLAGVWALTPALVLALLAAGPSGRRAALSQGAEAGAVSRISGRALALYLSVGAGLLVAAAAGLTVIQRAASGGGWSAEIKALAATQVPGSMALPLAVGLGLAGALGLGLWPLHAGAVVASAAGSRGAARLVAGPVRWLGLDALIRLWAPLAPLGAAAMAPGLAGLAVLGALVAGGSARLEADTERRAAKIALVGWSLAALGVATLAQEGLCGALILGAAAGLGQPWLARSGPLTRLVIGGAGALGGLLVVIAALRFSALTLGTLGPWCACAGALALGLAGAALTCRNDNVDEDMSDGTWFERHARRWAMVAVTAGLGLVVARPGALLGRITAGSAGWVEAIALHRCLALVEPRATPGPLPQVRPTRCDSPIGGLRAGLQQAQGERGAGDD